MKALVNYFKIFYKYTGLKILVFTLLAMIGTLIDGFGLTIALPILEFGADPNKRSQYSNFIYDSFNSLGINVSIISLVMFVMILFSIKTAFKLIQEIIGSRLCRKACYSPSACAYGPENWCGLVAWPHGSGLPLGIG